MPSLSDPEGEAAGPGGYERRGRHASRRVAPQLADGVAALPLIAPVLAIAVTALGITGLVRPGPDTR
ncbi:hypothetical protein SANTM175S_04387 [Streptomyces antimycoticus]